MSFFNNNPTTLLATPVQSHELARPRAALVVARHLLGQPHFLLIGTRRDAQRLTLPGGKVDQGEAALQSAIRETIEEAGVFTDRHQPLGSYLHRKTSGRLHPTETFLARFAGCHQEHEPRDLHWLTFSEVASNGAIRQPIREQIEQAMELLPAYVAAA